MLAIKFKFRWAIRQVDATTVALVVKPGETPILDQRWITDEKLTDEEIGKAERAVVLALVGPKVEEASLADA